ncbi:TerB N-terminal domain-containing protein [Lachnoclostridium sp. Marseille-P6806]|uniref:TerB N-terminal domain-containing protein n=1 Tax=Lachnoclostridium sp. Marseille-P6806 TaxID=2364793 RepID=UPI00103077C9|nr:TerB N-terminal domain-containing protein [Lachnoclostridium sp. Marseille-P6806]
MELAELTAYAGEKYQIREQHKWADFPGFSVLCHPKTGKWVALLMRQWDTDTGTEIERCDLKCGSDSLFRLARPYLSAPIRMHGNKWISIAFEDRTESDIVFQLFDKAIASGDPQGWTIVLDSRPPAAGGAYQDTALPFSESRYRPAKEKLPERLWAMKRLYEYGSESVEARARNFYKQAVFMEEFEDEAPWTGDFVCYFPTYRDLTTRQLRGYFAWRTQIRRGNYERIAASAAYIYLYELLNGVGADSPEDALNRMKAFEIGYLDSGIGDKRMRQNLRRWMLEYAVLRELPAEAARQAADSGLIERDSALAVLREPERYGDEEVFSALCLFDRKRIKDSPVIALNPERGKRLFSEVWRNALAGRGRDKELSARHGDLFTLCFGEQKTRRWYPLSNAVYYEPSVQADRDYVLDDCRSYRCRNSVWNITAYEKLSFDRLRFQGLLHETDARLRRYLKTGRYLKEDPADEWAIPYIDAVMEADKRAILEAARPKLRLDLSGLEQIRTDAAETRNSLLTEEEREEEKREEQQEEKKEADEMSGAAAQRGPAALSLNPAEIRILQNLLRGKDVSDILYASRLMPSVTADLINEALFDEIGDTVLVCEGDRLMLVEEYIEELEQLLGGSNHG